jgi:hypothetical protein
MSLDPKSNSVLTHSMRGVSNYRRTKWFWLDSLLIPASKDDKDEETKKLKKLAISKIPAVYSGAFQVLVLDFELEHGLHSRSSGLLTHGSG